MGSRRTFLSRACGAAAAAGLALAFCVAKPVRGFSAEGQRSHQQSSTEVARPALASLEELSIERLRSRRYSSRLEVLTRLGSAGDAYERHFTRDGSPPHAAVLAAYDSDGLQLYTRIDVPASPAPARGFPVVVVVHGWQGQAAAPSHDFGYSSDSQQAELIEAFVDAGFMVLSPGLRGHGTVAGRPAQGIEFLAAWDNASYLSPVFYAIDILNLLGGLDTLAAADWPGVPVVGPVRADTSRVHAIGHSQGADALLIALAVSGEDSTAGALLQSGSLWSGCFEGRLEQAALYAPMASTLEAFMSGDQTWNGTPVGSDGRVNREFVFGWPPDWIETVDPRSTAWTWQAATWSTPTVAEALRTEFTEMYTALAAGVGDLASARFELLRDANGRTQVRHDSRVVAAMAKIDASKHPQYLREPLLLHHSDRDYYSPPTWNADLAERVNAAGGRAHDWMYPGNTHSLRISRHRWFSGEHQRAGFPVMIERELEFLHGRDPAAVRFP